MAHGAELQQKGEFAQAEHGEIAEYREAVRSNPQNDKAHVKLGMVLAVSKGNWEGAGAEQRQALRINPNNDQGHFALGITLEQKEDLPGALEEYHAACTLNSDDASYRKNYERLLQQMKK